LNEWLDSTDSVEKLGDEHYRDRLIRLASPDARMIPPEVLGHLNVAARDQSREFFNNIHPKPPFSLSNGVFSGSPVGRRHNVFGLTGTSHASRPPRYLWTLV
jgi:hypothetical protein